MSSEASATRATPYVKLATLADLEELVDVAFRAFIHDPVMNYFGNVKKMLEEGVDLKACRDRRMFYAFLIRACFLVGGRVTVVMGRAEGSTEDRILAGALWLPPRRRLAAWMVPTVLRAGVVSVLKGWGLTGFIRIVLDYQITCERTMHELFKVKAKKKSPEDSWYLQLTFTDPDYRGRGFMSLLVRDAFAHAPNDTFTLEATTDKSRDQYTHLGFEVCLVIFLFGESPSNFCLLERHFHQAWPRKIGQAWSLRFGRRCGGGGMLGYGKVALKSRLIHAARTDNDLEY
ncbi:hypothetical protein GALMADRAFT_245316 [Galerina marginata CBS 339.88]|uniref:N-acetyltransferase domain-containing protein n=1 Tax=Galerina marginata (strain CBS 339.88) TaxID=685588 RepID=A0A067T522_GALM3|nr:hypothetical protein GALMADRAFT_245316 [Galerina marginata CBS 339.88]